MGLLSTAKDKALQPFAIATASYLRNQAKADFEKRNNNPTGNPFQTGKQIMRTTYDANMVDPALRRKPASAVSFDTLRRFSQTHEISRICINARKRQITQLEWEITATDPEDKSDYSKPIQDLKAYFKNLGGYRMRFRELQDTLIEDLLALDAMCLYKQRDNKGDIKYFMPVDASTIKLRVDDSGNTPEPPETAYIQYIRGKITGEYTGDEMIYEMMNPRTDTPYGLAPLESLILIVTSSLKATMYNLDYLTAGNIPEGLLEMPADWSQNQIEEYMTYFDALVAGNSQETTKMKPIPPGSTYHETKKPSDMAFDKFQEWLMQVTCGVFDIQPHEIGFTMHVNRATGKEQNDIATRRSILPLANLLKEVWDDIIQVDLGYPELQFQYVGLEDRDMLVDAQTKAARLAAGLVSIDEVRKDEGLDPLGGQAAIPYIAQPGQPVFLNMVQVLPDDESIPTSQGGNNPDDISSTQAHGDASGESSNSKLMPTKAVEPEIVKEVTPEERHIELVSELKRFEKYALKRIKDHKPLRKFESEVLPEDMVSELNERIQHAETKETAKAIIKEYKDDYQTGFLEEVLSLKSDLHKILG